MPVTGLCAGVTLVKKTKIPVFEEFTLYQRRQIVHIRQ